MALSNKKLLSVDPLTGLMTFHQYDDTTDETIISYDAPSAPILERNKELQNDAEYTKQGIKKDFWHYADIPAMVQMEWLIQKGVDVMKKEDGKKMFQLLNDPEYRHLKVTTKVHVCKE